jgi:hypothetical protein
MSASFPTAGHTESLVARNSDLSLYHNFAYHFQSLLSFPSHDFKTFPTSPQLTDAPSLISGQSLISRILKLACTFQSKIIENNT